MSRQYAQFFSRSDTSQCFPSAAESTVSWATDGRANTSLPETRRLTTYTTIRVSLLLSCVGRVSSQCIHWPAVSVKALDGKHITQIACGPQHSIALDSEGVVYVWGYNGYCRLGLGHQKDTLFPTPVSHVRPSTQEPRNHTVFMHVRFAVRWTQRS